MLIAFHWVASFMGHQVSIPSVTEPIMAAAARGDKCLPENKRWTRNVNEFFDPHRKQGDNIDLIRRTSPRTMPSSAMRWKLKTRQVEKLSPRYAISHTQAKIDTSCTFGNHSTSSTLIYPQFREVIFAVKVANNKTLSRAMEREREKLFCWLTMWNVNSFFCERFEFRFQDGRTRTLRNKRVVSSLWSISFGIYCTGQSSARQEKGRDSTSDFREFCFDFFSRKVSARVSTRGRVPIPFKSSLKLTLKIVVDEKL